MSYKNKGTYLSIDIEADGKIPGVSSMLSFGVVAFDQDGNEFGGFTRNLNLLPGAVQDPGTMEFWSEFPDSYAETRKGLVTPLQAMQEFKTWVDSLPEGFVTVIGYPSAYDFMWIYWYYVRFLDEIPRFSFSALDIKTYASALLKQPYKYSTKRNWKRGWKPSSSGMDHHAGDDARRQGESYFKMRKENEAKHTVTIIAPSGGSRARNIEVDEKRVGRTVDGVVDDDTICQVLKHVGHLTTRKCTHSSREYGSHFATTWEDLRRLLKDLGNSVEEL